MSLPIVASSIPIAVGAAFGFKQAGSRHVAVGFLGDAAVEEGVFHESANFAAIKKLPVVFVCENNLYSVYTRLNQRQPNRPISDLPKAHGLPIHHADGNDVLSVYKLTRDAVERARSGEGPTFLLFDTYRWLEHCGPNYDNDIGYRTEEEFLRWKERCPVDRMRQFMSRAGALGPAEERAMIAEVDAEIERAFAFARSAPLPEATTAGSLVYA
jgi:pyruvate dehydrogenase E1 component alpha subunit